MALVIPNFLNGWACHDDMCGMGEGGGGGQRGLFLAQCFIEHAGECIRVCRAVIQPKLPPDGFPGWRKGPCPAGGSLGKALKGWPSH